MLEPVPSASVSFDGLLAVAWWGFAEADPGVLGLIVIALAGLAALYTFVRLLRARAGRRAEGPGQIRRA